MSQECWIRISGPTTGRVVLAIDFGISRPEAGFDKFAAQLGTGLALYEPDVRTRTLADSRNLTEWLTYLPVPPESVEAIMGYCNGSSLACALATELSVQSGHSPIVVLFDPAVVHRKTLYQDFIRAVRPFQGVLPDELLDRQRREAVLLARMAGGDLMSLAVGLCRRYDRMVRDVMIELDFAPSYAEELSTRFQAYLVYLLDAAGHDIRTGQHVPAVILSHEHDSAAPASWPAVRYAVPRSELLSNATVGQAVTELLACP